MSPVIQMCMTSVIRNRWLRSIWMLNTMLARKMISAERYWPAYRHCAMRFRSCIEYFRLLTFVHERDGNVCQVCGNCHGVESCRERALGDFYFQILTRFGNVA